jgi:hypothetical protein
MIIQEELFIIYFLIKASAPFPVLNFSIVSVFIKLFHKISPFLPSLLQLIKDRGAGKETKSPGYGWYKDDAFAVRCKKDN